MPGQPNSDPVVSVIVLNYNGACWIKRCLESVRNQTIFEKLEVIVADNASPDKSDELAAAMMKDWMNGRVVRNGGNLGYCEGNNRAARVARGKWLLFLNNDAWLERDCLEILLSQTEAAGAEISGPQILDYDSDNFQSLGAAGFDVFGLPSTREPHGDLRAVFMPEGCAYLILRRAFEHLGGFDPQLFMYVDEFDLSWRAWLAGFAAVAVPEARLHHRGAAQVNPAGGGSVTELRTSDSKRYYTNRNSLLAVLKNAQGLLLLLAGFQLVLLLIESVASLVLIHRWGFVSKAYLHAVRDAWRMRRHIMTERERIKGLRQRSDLWLLCFLKARLNRWDELQRFRRFGLPKITG